jgi:hypothetical protein
VYVAGQTSIHAIFSLHTKEKSERQCEGEGEGEHTYAPRLFFTTQLNAIFFFNSQRALIGFVRIPVAAGINQWIDL